MSKRTRWVVIPALCAVLIALLPTMLRPAHTSDFSLGLIVGVLLGLSIVSLLKLRGRSA